MILPLLEMLVTRTTASLAARWAQAFIAHYDCCYCYCDGGSYWFMLVLTVRPMFEISYDNSGK